MENYNLNVRKLEILVLIIFEKSKSASARSFKGRDEALMQRGKTTKKNKKGSGKSVGDGNQNMRRGGKRKKEIRIKKNL